MRAELMLRERRVLARGFIEIVIWKLPSALTGSVHGFKYRLAYVVDGQCVIRYDNEAGKGDHWHEGAVEMPYRFVSVDRLLDDFLGEVAAWQDVKEG